MYVIQEDSADKKNISHFTDKNIFSFGRDGCTMKCKWCLNEETVRRGEDLFITPEQIIEKLNSYDKNKWIVGACINEPLFDWRTTFHILSAAKRKGFETYISTNGFNHINTFPKEMYEIDYIDLDIKAPPVKNSKFKEFTGVDIDKYWESILVHIKKASEINKKMNLTLLYIPDWYKRGELYELANTLLPYKNLPISVRAFYAANETFYKLRSSFSEDTEKVVEQLKGYGFNARLDINYVE